MAEDVGEYFVIANMAGYFAKVMKAFADILTEEIAGDVLR
jgi:hypothetical protein